MTLDEIREELQNADGLPARALAEAVAQASALAPEIIALIGKATRGVFLMPKEENLLFFGLHAVAAARETSVYRPLVSLLRLPEERIDRLLGDTATDTATGMLLALYDGDADPLFAAAEDKQADGSARWGMFQTLARLTWEGRIPRDRMVDLLDRFDRDEMAEPGDLAWIGWQDAVMLLGLEDFAPRVEDGWRSGRGPFENEADHREWRRLFRHAVDNPDDPQRFIDDDVTPIDDPVEALSWIAWPGPEPEPKVPDEPADPAETVKLAADELGWLAGFLVSGQTPDATMTVEELDGFFTALVAGPELVPPSEYMPTVWGGEDDAGPVFDSEEQAQFVVGLLMRHWSTIAARLDMGLPHVPLIYADAIEHRGREWATGFMQGLALRRDAWMPLIRDQEAGPAVLSIMALIVDEYDAAEEAPTPEMRAVILESLPLVVSVIRQFWSDGTALSWPQQPVRVGPKVGRNEPCPCGSGRKYKKCCGAPGAARVS